MKFLFESVTLSGNEHFYYRIYQTAENAYYAEVFDNAGTGWHFRKVNDEWVADNADRQYEAEQVGEVIVLKRKLV